MKKYDFDKTVVRKNTNCIKYDFAVERGYPQNVLPLWVADMDFQTAPCVLNALQKTVDHGIFGYSEVKIDYYDAVSNWFLRRFGWKTESEWLVKTPGVVYALAMAIRALTNAGDSIIIQTPVYYPFYSVIEDNERKLVENELIYHDGRYDIDFDDFENKIKENNVKLFILCSPHNPIGRVWTLSELRRLGQICRKHSVYVISDEIHCDFAFPEHPHTIFIKACPELSQSSIVCTAPSKSFNLAGLQISNIWIPSEEIRKKFNKEISASGYSQLNTMGLVAAKAAYEGAEEWFEACSQYMRDNLEFVNDYLIRLIPEIKLVYPEGTYFAWLDCSGLKLGKDGLNELIIKRAGLWIDAGHIFGKQSEQFQRLVLACPRETLRQALQQLDKAIHTNSYDRKAG